MYAITKMMDGTYWCTIKIQDGTEVWREKTEDKAISSVIAGAYAWNHSRINKQMIKWSMQEPQPIATISEEDLKLLADIKSGHKKVLDFDDFRLVANLLPEEVEMLYAIREGGK